ncbi:MAG: TIGR03086 family protein [Actinomycetia bacterium]|nr:TIGR03086 family protein [Actinomycetes bacterium]MCH9759762.1 TIGR03086 family protein [Actinomycetes bacterium]
MPFEKSVVLPLQAGDAFALITEPDRLRRWMTVAARVDLRAGGEYRWTVTPGHVAAGTFVEVDPGRRVVFSWGWELGGDPLPSESTVAITLAPVADGTEVHVVHDGLTEEQAARHAEGWNHYLDRLVIAGRSGDAGPDDWSAVPDQIDELSSAEATLAVLQNVLRGMDAADLAKPTPCTEFSVSQLLEHLLGSITAIGEAAGAQIPARAADAPCETQVADAAQVALEAWRRRGVQGMVPRGSSEMPAAIMAGVMSLEFLVHAWDFATATGRDVVVSEPVCDYVLELAGKAITPKARSFAGFADAVDAAPGAAVLDRLVAFTGRQPTTTLASAG